MAVLNVDGRDKAVAFDALGMRTGRDGSMNVWFYSRSYLVELNVNALFNTPFKAPSQQQTDLLIDCRTKWSI